MRDEFVIPNHVLSEAVYSHSKEVQERNPEYYESTPTQRRRRTRSFLRKWVLPGIRSAEACMSPLVYDHSMAEYWDCVMRGYALSPDDIARVDALAETYLSEWEGMTPA